MWWELNCTGNKKGLTLEADFVFVASGYYRRLYSVRGFVARNLSWKKLFCQRNGYRKISLRKSLKTCGGRKKRLPCFKWWREHLWITLVWTNSLKVSQVNQRHCERRLALPSGLPRSRQPTSFDESISGYLLNPSKAFTGGTWWRFCHRNL